MDTIAPLTTTGGPLVGLVNAANTANPNSRVYIRRDLDNIKAYNLGILERGSPITFGNITRPGASISASAGEDATQVNRFRLIQNPSDGSLVQQSLDELRIGTTWSDVTPVPEPRVMMACFSLLMGLALVRRRTARQA